MFPGKEHEEQFADYVAIGDIKVVLQGRDINVSIDLVQQISRKPYVCLANVAHVLLHVFCAMLQCRLPNLKAHLCRGIIYEISIGAE